jgi:hypothetical protein
MNVCLQYPTVSSILRDCEFRPSITLYNQPHRALYISHEQTFGTSYLWPPYYLGEESTVGSICLPPRSLGTQSTSLSYVRCVERVDFNQSEKIPEQIELYVDFPHRERREEGMKRNSCYMATTVHSLQRKCLYWYSLLGKSWDFMSAELKRLQFDQGMGRKESLGSH